RQQHEQQQRTRSLPVAERRRRRRPRPAGRRPAREVRGPHADDEPAAHAARQGRRADRVARRQHRHDLRSVTPRGPTVMRTASVSSAAIAALLACIGPAALAGSTTDLVAAAKAGDTRAALALLGEQTDTDAAEADGTTA